MDPAVIGKKIKEFYPEYKSVDDVTLGSKYIQKYGPAVSGVSSGQINIKDIPEKQRVGVSLGLQATGYKPKETVSAEVEKQEAKVTDLSKSLDVLEQNYKQIETKGPVAGQLGKFFASISGGSYNPEIADYEALRKGLIGPVARAISGEVGVLTDKDIKRAENLLPKVTDAAGLASRKLNNLKGLIEKKGGPAMEESGVEGATGGSSIERLFRRKQEEAGQLESQQKERLTQGDFGGLVKGATSAAIGQSPLAALTTPEGRGATGEIAGALMLMNLLKGGAAKKLLSPRKALGEAQTKAATEAGGAKIDTSKILKAGKEYVKDDPGAKKILKTATSAIKGSENPEQLLRKLQVWKEAYSSAGRVGKSSKAGIYNKLYKAGIEELKEKAPEVYKARRKLALTYEIPKKAGKVVWEALKYSALGKLLTGGGF